MAIKINKNQKALMTKAGFKASFPFGEQKLIDPLVYWVRGDVVVKVFSSDNITLNDLIDEVICQSSYRALQAERTYRPSISEIKFKYKNK